jgi:hypothetical protein
MVDSLAQGYHWTLDEVFKLTMPQIILMSHAAHINSKRMDERIERDREKDEYGSPGGYISPTPRKSRKSNFDPVVMDDGERMSDLVEDFDKLAHYLGATH